jgi:hypothetical protein
MMPEIEFTHFLKGKMRVRIAEDHTWWLKQRHWTDVNSDGEVYEDGDFEETRAEINALLSKAELDRELSEGGKRRTHPSQPAP